LALRSSSGVKVVRKNNQGKILLLSQTRKCTASKVGSTEPFSYASEEVTRFLNYSSTLFKTTFVQKICFILFENFNPDTLNDMLLQWSGVTQFWKWIPDSN